MNDALGSPQSVLVLGGTSDIARAVLRRLIARRTRRVVLAGRDPGALERVAAEARDLGATDVATVGWDATDTDAHQAVVDKAFADGDIDLVLVAVGVLGNQDTDEHDPRATAEVITTNFTGAAAAGVAVADRLRAQGHGTIVVLSSVAGERARRANFVYGASKAGLDAFYQGLGDALAGTGVRVIVVRPGFVHTRMTAGRPPAPMSTTPEAVAEAIERALGRGPHTVWVPAQLRAVMAAMRHLPRPVFRRLRA